MSQQADPNPSRPHLLRDRRYWPFFWTQFSGAFNDNFFKNALVFLIVFTELQVLGLDSKTFTAFASAIFIFPFFLFSATGGQLADKLEKSQLIRWIKTAEIGIMTLASIGFISGQYELLVLVLFLMGAQSALFGPVKYGILPQISDEDQLVGANALVEMATYVAILLGTIVGTLVINLEWGGQPVGLWLVCGGILGVSCLGRLFAGKVTKCPSANPDLKIQWDPIRPTWKILRLAVSKRVLFLTICAISWFWAFGAMFVSLFPTYTKDLLQCNEQVATLFLALFSIGIASGSMLAERLSKHRLELGIVPIGAIGMSLFCGDLFLVGVPWVHAPVASNELLSLTQFLSEPIAWRITFDLFMIAVCGGIFIVPLYTLLQQRADDSSRSQIIAGNNIINSLLMVIASLSLMFMLGPLNEPQIFGILALLNAVVALLVFSQLPIFLLRFAVWMLSNVFYRVKVVGHENIPDKQACVVAPNHISFIDWMLVAGAIKRPVHFVMDVSFANLPLMKLFARREWVIPIASPKRDEVAYEQAFVSIRRKLREGWLVGIFPEGMITHHGEMNEFKRGVEKIIERDPVPVIPVAINGMWGSWFSREGGKALGKRPRGWLSRVVITIGTPISPDQASAESIQMAVEELYKAKPEIP